MTSPIKFESKSFNLSNIAPIDMHKVGASRTAKALRIAGASVGGGDDMYLDANVWLPRAAEEYNLSKDLRDYILAPVVVNISEIPNTNGDSFSLKEWLKFNVQQKCLGYQTFKAAPCHIEHRNKNHKIASGVILDSRLRKLENFHGNHAKLILLHAFDRTRDRERCNRILSGELNTYSIGVWYTSYKCSICGAVITGSTRTPCTHTRLKQPVYRQPDGRLVYRECMNLNGFESSSVEDPAFVCAANDIDQLIVPR